MVEWFNGCLESWAWHHINPINIFTYSPPQGLGPGLPVYSLTYLMVEWLYGLMAALNQGLGSLLTYLHINVFTSPSSILVGLELKPQPFAGLQPHGLQGGTEFHHTHLLDLVVGRG